MARNASVIEINGNRYDAVTGQVIGAAKRVAAQVKKPTSGVIDGLVRRPVSLVSSVKSDFSSDKATIRQRYKASSARRQTQRSQTLMRGAVKKPSNFTASNQGNIKSQLTINPAKISRAKTIGKNSRVAHFGIVPARKHFAGGAISRPARTQSLATKNQASTLNQAATSAALPSMVASASHQHLEKLLDHALWQADAHKLGRRRNSNGWRKLLFFPRWATLASVFLILVLLAGFYAWQSVPQVSMRIAGAKVHVKGAVPSYAPSGYSIAGPVKINGSQVLISYKAGNAAEGYVISEEASNWDSSSVAVNAVPAGTQVQSSQVNGTTVYIYGQSNDAAWVNHGVLFNLQDKANLSSDQILKIARGL